MMMLTTAPTPADALQGLIESQALRIEILRAQIHAFQALAETIEHDVPRPMPVRHARPRPRIVQNIPA
jgi:hypothetical protein